jgi:hypothetical protein
VNTVSSACSLSLPELRVDHCPEEVQPHRHRPQRSSSSGEEGENLAASHYTHLRHAPLLGAKAKNPFVGVALADLHTCSTLATCMRSITYRQLLCHYAPTMTLPSLMMCHMFMQEQTRTWRQHITWRPH